MKGGPYYVLFPRLASIFYDILFAAASNHNTQLSWLRAGGRVLFAPPPRCDASKITPQMKNFVFSPDAENFERIRRKGQRSLPALLRLQCYLGSLPLLGAVKEKFCPTGHKWFYISPQCDVSPVHWTT